MTTGEPQAGLHALLERLESDPDDGADLMLARWLYDNAAKLPLPPLVNYDPELWLIKNGGWTASLDATISLAERMLPGWSWGVCSGRNYDAYVLCANGDRFDANAPAPALALCIAVVRALIAQSEGQVK